MIMPISYSLIESQIHVWCATHSHDDAIESASQLHTQRTVMAAVMRMQRVWTAPCPPGSRCVRCTSHRCFRWPAWWTRSADQSNTRPCPHQCVRVYRSGTVNNLHCCLWWIECLDASSGRTYGGKMTWQTEIEMRSCQHWPRAEAICVLWNQSYTTPAHNNNNASRENDRNN